MRKTRPAHSVSAAILTAALSLGAAVESGAADGEPLDGATLYQTRTCIACHGADGKTTILPDYPKLAGQNEAYLLLQMKDIKSGARTNSNTPAMRGVMHLVDDEEMKALARYIAGLAP